MRLPVGELDLDLISNDHLRRSLLLRLPSIRDREVWILPLVNGANVTASEPPEVELLAAEAAVVLAALDGELAFGVPDVSVLWFAARHPDGLAWVDVRVLYE